MVHEMARKTNTRLTAEHYKVLEFAAAYYEEFRVGPLYFNFRKYINVNPDRINLMFPNGLQSVYGWTGIPIHSKDNSCKPVPDLFIDDFRDIYFNNMATTPLRKEVRHFLNSYNEGELGYANPSSGTGPGGRAHYIIEKARRRISKILQVESETIHFTGSGSEANNFAIKGLAFRNFAEKGHLIVTKIAHSSILKTARYLKMRGWSLTELEVSSDGLIDAQQVENAIRANTIMVAVMAVNNEIGTINPLADIGRICKLHNIPLFVDAVQAFGKIEIYPENIGISMMSFSGHKIYAPKGVGALYVEKGLELDPLIHGGGQESGYRAGTENVGSIGAFGLAAKLAHQDMLSENSRLQELQKYFFQQLDKNGLNYIVNGSLDHRIPHNLSIGFRNVDSGTLLLALNQIGIYVSAGSACNAGDDRTSHVLEAIGIDPTIIGTIRFSFGRDTCKNDIDYLFKYLPKILEIISSK